MYNIDKSEEAATVIQEGRRLAWFMLRSQGLKNIDQSNINGGEDVKVDAERKKIDDSAVNAFASATAPAGKDAKGKAAAPAKGGGKADPKAPATAGGDGDAGAGDDDGKKKLDFSGPVTYALVAADVEINTSKAP